MRRFLVSGVVLMAFGACIVADPGGSAVILDTSSFRRVHDTVRPPVVRDGDKVCGAGDFQSPAAGVADALAVP